MDLVTFVSFNLNKYLEPIFYWKIMIHLIKPNTTHSKDPVATYGARMVTWFMGSL